MPGQTKPKVDISASDLKQALIDAHPILSPQLQRISQYVLENPGAVAILTIADLSQNLGVQPSSFIRLSKSLGLNGFSDIQRVFKQDFAAGGAPENYFDRLRQSGQDSSSTIGRFSRLAETSLAHLPSQTQIDEAASIMAQSRIIHLVGHRRAFGIASYLNYMLGQFAAKVNLLAFVGGMHEARMSFMEPSDCLVALTFPDYTSTAVDAVASAKDQGLKVIAITDSLVSPIAKHADVCLLTDPQTEAGFRSAVGGMVTVQALAVTYGELKTNP